MVSSNSCRCGAERLARRDLADVAVVRGARRLVVHEHAAAAAPRPGLELDGVQVRHVGRADDVEPFALHPAGVGRLFFGREFLGELVRNDGVLGHVSALRWTPAACGGCAAEAPGSRVLLYGTMFQDSGAKVPSALRRAQTPAETAPLDLERAREMPHGRPVTIRLPTVPKSRWDQSQQTIRGNATMRVSANKLAAVLLGALRGIARGCRRHPRRAIRRATSRRSSRSRPATPTTSPRASCSSSCQQAARPADRDREPRRRRRHHRRRPGGARDAGRLHHPVPFGVVQRLLRDAQDAALRHVQRFHRR